MKRGFGGSIFRIPRRTDFPVSLFLLFLSLPCLRLRSAAAGTHINHLIRPHHINSIIPARLHIAGPRETSKCRQHRHAFREMKTRTAQPVTARAQVKRRMQMPRQHKTTCDFTWLMAAVKRRSQPRPSARTPACPHSSGGHPALPVVIARHQHDLQSGLRRPRHSRNAASAASLRPVRACRKSPRMMSRRAALVSRSTASSLSRSASCAVSGTGIPACRNADAFPKCGSAMKSVFSRSHHIALSARSASFSPAHSIVRRARANPVPTLPVGLSSSSVFPH